MKKTILATIKVAASAAILAYLGYQAWRDDSFHELVSQPKHWQFLALGGVCTFLSVLLTYMRWWFLVRRLGLSCSLREACRLGFLGYLFNFFSLGVIGGDVLRAVFLARHNPRRRSAAVASVFLDRFIGLYVLFVVALIGTLMLDVDPQAVRDPREYEAFRRLCQFTNFAVLAGGIGAAVVLAPWVSARRWGELVRGIPVLNRFRERIEISIETCRQHSLVLVGSFGASLVVHGLNVVGIYCVARGLPGESPSLAAHVIVAPLAILAGTVPLPGGLGAVEYALDFLYRAVSPTTVAARQGFLVAIGYRVVTMAIAAVGFVYYLTSRGEVRELIEEATHEQEEANEANSGEVLNSLA